MRPDVKLGVVISMVIVAVAGGYFFMRNERQIPIPVATGPDALSSGPATTGAAERKASKPKTRVPKRSAPLVRSGAEGRRTSRPQGKRAVSRSGRASVPDKRQRRVADRTTPGGQRPAETVTRPVARAEDRSPTGNAMTKGSGRGPLRPSDSALAQRASTPKEAPKDPAVDSPPRRGVRLTATTPVQDAVSGGVGTDNRAAVERHRVQPGDTLSSLAQRYYGRSDLTHFLAKRNPQIADPNRLRPGDLVVIPPRPVDGSAKRASVKSPADPRPPSGERTYRVRPGDSFYKIARDVLGDATRWKELLELNKDLVNGDPTRLQVNQVVVLPKP